jgi:Domain of unknown function (DUF4260)
MTSPASAYTSGWQRAESVAVLVIALLVYKALGGPISWLAAIVFFLPDVSMAGYLFGPRAGAHIYNVAHNHVGPAVLAGAHLLAPGAAAAVVPFSFGSLAALWFAHIAFDRMLGYGLKETSSFGATHLGQIGRKSTHARPDR